MEMTGQELIDKAVEKGIRMFSDTDRLNRASSAANTCVFKVGKTLYVLDPAFGARRRRELVPYLKDNATVHVLCTHYHNDHCANNGWVAKSGSRVYYHHRVRSRIHYLRTNGTGQILTMGHEMDLAGMLKRFGMFPGWMIRGILGLSRISRLFPDAFLFGTSYLYSLNNIGLIRPGWFKTAYLKPRKSVSIRLDHMGITGWDIDDGLYAMEATGHSDDHVAYYLKQSKALFAGDALNFLNGNDIQYGDIEKVDQALDFMYEFVTTEQVEVLFQGHYYPVFGTDAIAAHIDTIREKHRAIREITQSVIESMPTPFRFDEVLSALRSHPSDLAQKLSRIAFPRSTLVFLDVYLLKVLQSLGYERGKDRKWRAPGVLAA